MTAEFTASKNQKNTKKLTGQRSDNDGPPLKCCHEDELKDREDHHNESKSQNSVVHNTTAD